MWLRQRPESENTLIFLVIYLYGIEDPQPSTSGQLNEHLAFAGLNIFGRKIVFKQESLLALAFSTTIWPTLF